MAWCAIGVPAAVFSGYTTLLILGSAQVAVMDKETRLHGHIYYYYLQSTPYTKYFVIRMPSQ